MSGEVDARVVVSVVVPTHNGGALLIDQLDRLDAETVSVPFEVVVADNNSTDGTAERVRRFRRSNADVRVVSAPDRAGVSYARNVGIAAARGSHILIVDGDDLIEPGWVEALHQGLKKDALVGGRFELREINPPAVLAWHGEQVAQTELPRAEKYLPYIPGGNLGVRKEVVAAVGAFDEWFVGGHEEVDFCWRAQHAGYSVAFVPEAILHYRQRATLRATLRQRYWYGRSAAQLAYRYADQVTRPRLRRDLRWMVYLVTRDFRYLRSQRPAWLLDMAWALGHMAGVLRYRRAPIPLPPAAS
ncbi:MAG: glycosyltransferase family 2 protein [Beutenbergiaceae bacterium]